MNHLFFFSLLKRLWIRFLSLASHRVKAQFSMVPLPSVSGSRHTGGVPISLSKPWTTGESWLLKIWSQVLQRTGKKLFFFLSVMETGQVAESKGETPRMWERRKNSYVGTEGEVSLGFSWCFPNGPELFNKSDLCSWPHVGFCWAFKAISTNIYATFSNLQSVFRDIMSSSGQEKLLRKRSGFPKIPRGRNQSRQGTGT